VSMQPTTATMQVEPDPQPIVEAATAFMRAKHLFAAAELGVFEGLATGARTVDELARDLGLPRRTARIIVDAVTALGFLDREDDRYKNGPVAQDYLSGRGALDMRPFMRFFNRLSYRRWITLEDSVRRGSGVSGEFNFTPDEQRIFSEGVEAFTASQAAGLLAAYDFSRHRRILDVGGGTGNFLQSILERYPAAEGTLFELPQAAAVARTKLRGTPFDQRIRIVEGDFFRDALPKDHDALIVANVVHVLDMAQNERLFRHMRACAAPGARLFLVDFWTNLAHTEPLFAALMAGEFLVTAGNGDVYSVDEGRTWLVQSGWHFLEHKPVAGPASLLMAEA